MRRPTVLPAMNARSLPGGALRRASTAVADAFERGERTVAVSAVRLWAACRGVAGDREPYWQGPVHVESAGRQRRTQNPISQQERLGTVHRAGGGTLALVVEHLYERLQHHRDRQPEQQRSGRQRQCGCALLRYAARRIWDGVEGLHGPAQPVRAGVGWGLLPVSVGWTDQEACPTSARSSR